MISEHKSTKLPETRALVGINQQYRCTPCNDRIVSLINTAMAKSANIKNSYPIPTWS